MSTMAMPENPSAAGLCIIPAEAVRSCLSVDACIDLMAETMIAVSKGAATIPPRTVTRLPNGQGFLGLMPGAFDSPGAFGVKVVSLYPNNPAASRPALQGMFVLFDHASGTPVAVIDAASITAIRTGAASGAATRALAREDAKVLFLMGCGIQAESHLDAMLAIRPIERVMVWGRSRDRAEQFVTRHSSLHQCRIESATDPAIAASAADIICTVTASSEPVVNGDWLGPGTHLNLVGSHSPTAREADTKVLQRARVFVELRDIALKEAGEFVIPLQAGEVKEDIIAGEIAAVYTGQIQGRTNSDEITVYKSLGNVAQDIAAAARIFEICEADCRMKGVEFVPFP